MSKISSLITGTDYDLADALFNSTSAETGEGAVSNNVTRIEAVARADSDSGTVTVDFGGETVSGDNLQAVEVDATVSVKEGDSRNKPD